MNNLSAKKTLVLLFFVAFVVKFLTALFIRYLLNCLPITYHLDDVVIRGHDYFSYHGAMENYVQTGHYYFFNGKENVYAGRLPHYSLLYLTLRQFLNIPLANFGVVVFQLVVEAAAIISMALLATRVIGTRASFYITYGLGLLSLATSFYTIQVLPDSLSVSYIIFFAYFLHCYLHQPEVKWLLLTGLFVGLLVVLKPHFGLLYLVVVFYLTRQIPADLTWVNWLVLAQKVILLTLPLLIMLTPWIIRNYRVQRQFIPLTVTIIAGYNYTPADLACRRFLQSFGEDFLYWDTTSAAYYFKTCPNSCSYQFPAYITTKKYGIAQVEAVRKQYGALQQNFSEEADARVASIFEALTQTYKHEKPFRYHILARLRSIKNFTFYNGSNYLPIRRTSPCYSPYHLLIYYSQLILYWSTLTVGLLGLILSAKENSNNLFILFIPVFLVLFFPIVLRWTEGRYFIHSYPFLLIGLVYVVERLRQKWLLKAKLN